MTDTPRTQNWYNRNTNRAYPFSDGCILPDYLLCDASIRFPRDYGEVAYASAVTITSRLATVVFHSSRSPQAILNPVPLCSATLVLNDTSSNPTSQQRPYTVQKVYPLSPGVVGWVVFGDVATFHPSGSHYQTTIHTLSNALLLPQCARSYPAPPVRSLSKLGVGQRLTGLVTLKAGKDIRIRAKDLFINGRQRRVIAIGLDPRQSDKNVYSLYTGPCQQRPESGNCDRTPVQALGPAIPDCSGNIEIIWRGGLSQKTPPPYPGTIVVQFNQGLSDICPKEKYLPDKSGNLPFQRYDDCAAPWSSYPFGGHDDYGEVPPAASVGSDYFNSSLSLNYIENFDDQAAQDFTVLFGTFDFYSQYKDHAQTGSLGFYSGLYSYRSRSLSGRNVSVLNKFLPGGSINKRVRTKLLLSSDSLLHRGGLVLNYHTVTRHGLTRDEYHSVELDLRDQRVRVYLHDGRDFYPIASSPTFAIALNQWYDLTVAISPASSSQVNLAITVRHVRSNTTVLNNWTVTTADYYPADGTFGVGSFRSVVHFADFSVEAL